MKSIVFLTFMFFLPLFLTSPILAQTPRVAIDAEEEKNLEWFISNTTRIYSLVTQVEYMDSITKEKMTKVSEFSSPNDASDCEVFDVNKNYTEYFHYKSIEQLNTNTSSGFSNWFEGVRLSGPVMQKEIVYCFAR